MKKTIFIIFFLVAVASVCFSQTPKIDSLLIVLKTAKEDTNKVNILFQISEECSEKDIIKYAGLSLELAEKLNYKKGIANATENIGFAHASQGDNTKAIAFHNKSLTIREEIGDKKGISSSLNNLGMIYKNLGDISNALDYYHKSLKLCEEIGDKKEIARLINNIASVYYNQGNVETALEYYYKSLKMRREIGDKFGTAYALNNIGLILFYKGKTEEALKNYMESLVLREKIGDKRGIAESLHNIGFLYERQNDFENALAYYLKSMKIKEDIGNKQGMAYTLNNIGGVFLRQKNYKKSEEYALRSFKLSKELGFPENIRNASMLLSSVYAGLGKYEDAYRMHMLYKQMADSVNNIETRKSAVKKELNYEFEKKEAATKAEQEKKDAVAAKEKQHQGVIIYSVSGGLFLVLLLALFIFRGYRQKQKANLALGEKNKIIEEKNKDIIDSIRYAQRIQHTILPSEEYFKELLAESFVLYKPKDIVSGDFYFLGSPTTNFGSKLVVFGAVDCTGHGVPGAFLTIIGKTFLQLGLTEKTVNSCADALNYLNKGVMEMLRNEKDILTVQDGMDASLCAINFATMEFEFAGAKNPAYIVRERKLIVIEPDKSGIGELSINQELVSYTNKNLPLQKNDCVYVFTDGYADQFGGPKGKKFKYKQLQEVLISIYDKSMPEQKKILDETIANWKGKLEQVDDILIIGVRL